MNAVSNIKEDVVNELHTSVRKNYRHRHFIIRNLNDLWQIDLAEMQPYAKFNRGFRYILVVINTCSKYVWTHPLKTKSGKEVAIAMKQILKKIKKYTE